jgi:hypothetical protein
MTAGLGLQLRDRYFSLRRISAKYMDRLPQATAFLLTRTQKSFRYAQVSKPRMVRPAGFIYNSQLSKSAIRK